MKTAVLTLALALTAGPALATPLSEGLDSANGALCYQGVDPRPVGQQWTKVRMSLSREGVYGGAPTLRLMLEGKGKPVLIYGVCSWMDAINRGGGGRILDPTFLPTVGVTCFMHTDVTGASAEEGGSFPMDWGGDGQTVQVHLPFTVAAWRGYDTRRGATWPDVAVADRVVRAERAPAEACTDLRAKFAPAKP